MHLRGNRCWVPLILLPLIPLPLYQCSILQVFKPIFNNAIQKGKKSKKGFPHLGIKLKTSCTEILAPLKTEQAVYVVMPRSTCFHSRANLVN